MFKLYYSPGACSLAPHIALREAGLPFELIKVDLAKGHATATGSALGAVNPKNQVPAFVLPNGQLLTEGAVILQYIADQNPDAKLLPAVGSFERVRAQEWLNFMATELHKAASPFHIPEANPEFREVLRRRLIPSYNYLADGVGRGPYLMGEQFSVADCYALYNIRAYKHFIAPALPRSLAEYHDRIVARPFVRAAFEAEGIS
jgi:glutathione S-transferase